MTSLKFIVVAAAAIGLATPALAHHNEDHNPPGNAYGHDKDDNPNKGKGHGEGDSNHGGKHDKWGGGEGE